MTGTELFTLPALSATGAATTVTLADALLVSGTILGAAGLSSAANSQRRSSNFEAAQMEQQAGQDRASAQRQAAEERRRARFAQSRALAVSAASGGAADPGALNILGDLEAEGEYRALSALYEGEESARGLATGAAARRYEGASARRSGQLSVLTAGSTLLEKYG
jgi:hypothetical protein